MLSAQFVAAFRCGVVAQVFVDNSAERVRFCVVNRMELDGPLYIDECFLTVWCG